MSILAHDEQYSERVKSEFKLGKKGKSETALVAGVAGFVGSRIAESLCDVGIHVIGVDSYVSGKERYLERLVGRENFEIIEANLQDGIPPVLETKNVKYVIDALNVFPHIGNTQLGLNELLNNSISLRNLLDFANKMKARMIFTSSVDIYQGLASHEYLQNYYDGRELTSYYEFLEGKRYGEALCREYVDRFDLDIRVARIAEVYGPRMDINSSSVLARAIRLSLEGKDLLFDEEGSQQHQLVFVDDLVYGLLKLLFADNEKIKGGIFYFVNPEPVSTLSIAYTLREVTGKDLKVEFLPQHRKVGFPAPPKIDISRTMKLLRWNPKIGITEGLEFTLSWFVDFFTRPSQIQHGQLQTLSPEVPADLGPQYTEVQEAIVPEADFTPQIPAVNPVQPLPVQHLSDQLVGTAPQDSQIESEDQDNPLQDYSQGDTYSGISEVPLPPQSQIKDQKGWLSFVKGDQQKKRISLQSVREVLTPKKLIALVPDILLGCVLFLLLVSIPLVIALGLSWKGFTYLDRGEYDQADRMWYQAGSLLQIYETPASWVGLAPEYKAFTNLLMTGVYGVRFIQSGQAALSDLDPVIKNLKGSFQGGAEYEAYTLNRLYSMTESALIDFRGAQTWFALTQQSLESVEEEHLSSGLQDRISALKEALWLASPIVKYGGTFLSQFDGVLGFDRPQRYIVWLQNSNEIRPTGGFIGSYLALTISEGRIIDFKVDDIYNPDGLLEPSDDPPVSDIMRKFFKVTMLYARDANWWVDFPTSAETFVTLYERATSEKVDGVFTVNLKVVEDLLKEIGPVWVELYDEEVSADNLFISAETHAEVGYEPGDTNKRDFLGALTESIMSTLISGDSQIMDKTVRVLAREILAKDIMFYFDDDDVQQTAADMTIAGELLEGAGDYIRIIDSNIGVNKVNYWMRRETKYSLDIDRDGYIRANMTIAWENTAESGSWPRGDYVNYMRVYLPEDIENVQIEPSLEELSIYKEFGKTVVAGVVRVPILKTTEVRLRYDLPKSIKLGSVPAYDLIWEPQAGIRNDTIDFSLNLPEFLRSDEETKIEKVLTMPLNIHIPVEMAN
jgi:nucleoside-diphosphate-sugar epimerase